jgi:hypothetical protein
MIQHHDSVITAPEARNDLAKCIMLALMRGWSVWMQCQDQKVSPL